jgi:hypothetical protein
MTPHRNVLERLQFCALGLRLFPDGDNRIGAFLEGGQRRRRDKRGFSLIHEYLAHAVQVGSDARSNNLHPRLQSRVMGCPRNQ